MYFRIFRYTYLHLLHKKNINSTILDILIYKYLYFIIDSNYLFRYNIYLNKTKQYNFFFIKATFSSYCSRKNSVNFQSRCYCPKSLC